MNVLVLQDYAELSKKGAMIIAEQVNNKKDSILGLATGSTPLGVYKELAQMYEQGKIDFSKVITFNLDEYYGLPENHPQSYRYYMEENFWSKVNLQDENKHIPPSITDNIELACKEYDELIESHGGIDLQILGIGPNGHIGFNEPGKELYAKTHLAKLTQNTIEANSRFFPDKESVPKNAITMGMGSIMKSKKILLLANGNGKAEIIRKTIKGQITTNVPASMLQLHPNVTVLLDEKAASKL